LTIVIQAHDQAAATHICRAFEIDARWNITSVLRDPRAVVEEVARQRPAAVLLMLGAQPQATWTLCQQVRQASPGTAVICAAGQASPDLILDTLRNGAREFLRLPIRPEELRTVLDRILETSAQAPHVPTKRGRVIAVFSPKGGCGVSFLAANVAAGIHAQTVLLDLNLQASSQDLYFKLKPRFSWVDLIENRARLDDQMLASLLEPCNDQLSLLAAPAKAEDADDARAEHIHEMVAALRARFDFTVIDAMHSFDALTIAALDEADEILLVLGLDIAAVRATQRALAIFQRLEYPREKVHLVLNRWNNQSDLELREVERAIGQPVKTLISEDYRTVVASLNLGQPLLAGKSTGSLVAELQKLLADCDLPNAGQLNASKRGLLDVLLRRNTAALPNESGPLKTTQALPPLPDSLPRTTPVPPPPPSEAETRRLGTAPLPAERDEPQALKTF
jgi:pilus assembly protein CpaE